MTEAGLRTRRGLVLSPQSFGQMVRNSIYVGRVESPDYGVSTRGDFEPLVDEATFYRVQAVLDGRVVESPRGGRRTRRRGHPGLCRTHSAARLRSVQASLDYKQRLQQLFLPEGIAFDGNRFNRTAATAPLFNCLAPPESADEKVVIRTGIEPVSLHFFSGNRPRSANRST